MLLRRITDFILRGRLQAMAAAFICVYVSLLMGGVLALLFVGIVGVAIAAFVTLRKGIVEGLLVTVAATLPYFLTYSGSDFWYFGMFVVVCSNMLTWLFAALLRKYSNWSLVLDLALPIGMIAVVGVHLCYPDVQNWWATQIISYASKSTQALAVAQNPKAAQEYLSAVEGVATTVKPFVTGSVTVSLLLGALLPLLIARWWQAIVFNPGGLRKELYEIRMSFVAGFIFVFCTVLTYFGNATALDIMPVLFGIYCLAGLSLLHAWVGPTKLSWLWLLLIYLGLIFFPFMVVIVVFAALLDTSVDFRKRLHKF